MRDYSEKRVARESIERKPIAKNRPRKEPGGMFLLLSLLALTCTFGAGVFTGWFFFKGPRQAAPVAVAKPARKEEPAQAPLQPKPDAPLTFYQTLPAGGKGTIGTGMNLKKPEPARAAARVAPVPAPAAHSAAEPGAAPADAPAAVPVDASEKPENPARFVVQVASYHEKQEALAAQTKLAGKGVAAYLVESRLPDKGVWYRLRVGRHLTRAEAGELAGKSGRGAIVLPE